MSDPKPPSSVERDWESLIEEGYECAISDFHSLILVHLAHSQYRELLAIIKKVMAEIETNLSAMRLQVSEYRDGRSALTEDEFEAMYESIEVKSYELLHLEKMMKKFSEMR